MDQARARELQEKLALEAAAMLSLAGSGAETAPYCSISSRNCISPGSLGTTM